MAPIRRIALFGLFGVRNLGNEATLAVTLRALRARLPDAHFTLISTPPEAGAGLGGGFDVLAPDPLPVAPPAWLPWRLHGAVHWLLVRITEPWRARRARRLIAAHDLLLVPGTGIADDFRVTPLGAPLDLARWCRAARRAGVPVRFASIGAGPVRNRRSRRWFARALGAAESRSYRDAASREFVRSLGLDVTRDPVLPDLAFGLEVPAGRAAPAWPPRDVGVGVMGFKGWNAEEPEGERLYGDYLTRLRQLVEGLLARGLTVRLLIGNRGGDRRPVRDLCAALGQGSARLFAADIESWPDLMREIGACDLVIATRFHNCLKALLSNRPVISLGYARKNEDLMAEMGLGEYCHEIESFRPERVLGQVDALRAMVAPPVAAIPARLAEYRRRTEEQFDILSEMRNPTAWLAKSIY